jgi:hypothetical protein
MRVVCVSASFCAAPGLGDSCLPTLTTISSFILYVLLRDSSIFADPSNRASFGGFVFLKRSPWTCWMGVRDDVFVARRVDRVTPGTWEGLSVIDMTIAEVISRC